MRKINSDMIGRRGISFLCPIWRFIFRRWLDDSDEVLAVVGWRSARIRTKTGNIKCITPIFWWFE